MTDGVGSGAQEGTGGTGTQAAIPRPGQPPSTAPRTNSLHARLYWCLPQGWRYGRLAGKSVHVKMCGHRCVCIEGGTCACMCGFRGLSPSNTFPGQNPLYSLSCHHHRDPQHMMSTQQQLGAACMSGATVLNSVDRDGGSREAHN